MKNFIPLIFGCLLLLASALCFSSPEPSKSFGNTVNVELSDVNLSIDSVVLAGSEISIPLISHHSELIQIDLSKDSITSFVQKDIIANPDKNYCRRGGFKDYNDILYLSKRHTLLVHNKPKLKSKIVYSKNLYSYKPIHNRKLCTNIS